MSGAGRARRPPAQVDEQAHDGGEVPVGVGLGQVVEPAQDHGGVVALAGERPRREAQRRHDAGGPQPAPGHVAHDQDEALVVERQRVVPVAADLHALHAGRVADGELPGVEVGKGLGEQAVLQGVGDPLLLLEQLGVLDRQALGLIAPAQQSLDEHGGAGGDDQAAGEEKPRQDGQQAAALVLGR